MPVSALSMICNRWSPMFKRLYGGEFPTTYTCIDCETSGFDRSKDVIVEFGLTEVEDRKVVRRQNIVLDWTNDEVVPYEWIGERLNRLERLFFEDGRAWRLSIDVMRDEGVEARAGLEFIYEYLMALQRNGELLVSHNGYAFDEELLAANFSGFLGKHDFSFGENSMIDTGAIVKANQCPVEAKWLPQPGDTLRSYFYRVVKERAPGVKWNLDTYCMKQYRLDKREGVTAEQCHGAGFDSYLVHLLMEELTEEMRREGVGEPSLDRAPASDYLSVADFANAVAESQKKAMRHLQRQRNS